MNEHAQAKTIIKKTLKTHVNNIKNSANHRAEQQENFPPRALALRIHLSRAHAASPRPLARTHARTKRNDFPVRGVLTRTHSPKPPIYEKK